jgi:pyruvate formate lyase activating enzyme
MDDSKIEKKISAIFNQRLSRREFIKKSIIGIGTLALAGYTFNRYLRKSISSDNSLTFENNAPDTLWKWSKEAEFYIKLPDAVQCKLCPHECVLSKNSRGFCRARVNKNNKLYTLDYGNPSAVHNDPVEKKPLFHFLPGSLTYSIACSGCNLRCKNCQNWEISQTRPEDTTNADMMPEAVVENAIRSGAKSISYTYTDPIIFYEYVLILQNLHIRQGLKMYLLLLAISMKSRFENYLHILMLRILT